MKFVFRYWYEQPACKGTKYEVLIYFDKRRFKSLKEARENPNMVKYWLSKGENHREENGIIVRDLRSKEWTIEINTLEELLKVMKQLSVLVHVSLVDNYKDCDFQFYKEEECGW